MTFYLSDYARLRIERAIDTGDMSKLQPDDLRQLLAQYDERGDTIEMVEEGGYAERQVVEDAEAEREKVMEDLRKAVRFIMEIRKEDTDEDLNGGLLGDVACERLGDIVTQAREMTFDTV